MKHQPESSMTSPIEYIFSTLATDPDFADIVLMYVDEMPQRAQQIGDAFARNDRETLMLLIHQLKGAAGSYGFPRLTEEATVAEQKVMANADDADRAIANLLNVCRMVRAGAGN